MRWCIALASGLVFGLGLITSGMSDPSKVKGFLDRFGAWDTSLALVLGGAISEGLFAFAAARRRTLSWTGERMALSTSTFMDGRLVGGRVLFCAGWGLSGFCPGPALVTLGAGLPEAAVFVGALWLGMRLHDRVVASGD